MTTINANLSEYSETTKVLLGDINEALLRYDKNPQDQFSRRAYVKAVFSYIEGHLYQFKQFMISLETIMSPCKIPVGNFRIALFTTAEVHILKERSYIAKSNGTAEERFSAISLQDNIQFTYHLLEKTLEINFRLDCSGIGWQALQKAQNIRNRITHPKKSADLIVSDQDIVVVGNAAHWYEQTTHTCTTEIVEKASANKLRIKNTDKDIEEIKDRFRNYQDLG